MNKQRINNEGTLTVYNPDNDKKVSHPEHYNKGIECWDYIASHNLGFLEGNVVKYITRYKYKNGKADLLKAKEYLNKLISEYEKNNNE